MAGKAEGGGEVMKKYLAEIWIVAGAILAIIGLASEHDIMLLNGIILCVAGLIYDKLNMIEKKIDMIIQNKEG